MTAEQIAEHLHARPAGPGRWRARCPAHHGKSATSLSVAQGEDSRVLLHCFGGCTTETICMSANLRVSDLFAERLGPQESRPPIVHIVAREIADLRRRLTLRERAALEPVVIITTTKNLDFAIARALALSVEGDLVQVVMFEGKI